MPNPGTSAGADRPDEKRAWEILVEHWQKLTPAERNRIWALLRQSRGRPDKLTASEREELQKLLGSVEVGKLMAKLAQRADWAQIKRQLQRRMDQAWKRLPKNA